MPITQPPFHRNSPVHNHCVLFHYNIFYRPHSVPSILKDKLAIQNAFVDRVHSVEFAREYPRIIALTHQCSEIMFYGRSLKLSLVYHEADAQSARGQN